MTPRRVVAPAFPRAGAAIARMAQQRAAALNLGEGVGFGMFASSDGSAFRHVRIFVEAPGRSEEIEMATSIEEAALRATLHPTDALLSDLADAVFEREWRQRRPVTTVRIEIWHTEFSGVPLIATDHRIRSFVLVVRRDA